MKRSKLKLEDFELIDKWNELIRHISSIEHEVFLNAKGNVAAGIRLRHALVDARKMLNEIKKRTLLTDKERKFKRHKDNVENS